MPELSTQLNQRLNDDCNHIGPISWNIDAKDWVYWRDDGSAAACAEAYLNEVLHINRGIVLMHDATADSKQMNNNNRTLEMIEIIVPRLKNLGYSFAGMNEIAGLSSKSGL